MKAFHLLSLTHLNQSEVFGENISILECELMLVISEPEKLRHVECLKFEASLGYIVSTGIAWAI